MPGEKVRERNYERVVHAALFYFLRDGKSIRRK